MAAAVRTNKTSADDSADSERDEIDRAERSLQAVLANFLSFGHQLVERFSRE